MRGVVNLPISAQKEILDIVKQIEERFQTNEDSQFSNGSNGSIYPLTFIADLATDVGVTDFADRGLIECPYD